MTSAASVASPRLNGHGAIDAGDDESSALEISTIRRDGATQHRRSLDEQLVALYVERMSEGSDFPPITVWREVSSYWLSDGFHRLAAAERVGLTHFRAEIRNGTLADAQWHSYGANSANGRPRSCEELQTVILCALEHPRAAALSNVEMARHLNIPEATLRRWRKRLSSPRGEDGVRTVRRGAQTYSINTGNHWCPVKYFAKPDKSSTVSGLRRFVPCRDLNGNWLQESVLRRRTMVHPRNGS